MNYRATLRLFWQQVRHHKPSFFIALTLVPCGVLLIDTLLPYFSSLAIGALTARDAATTFHNITLAAIVGALGFVCNIVGFQALTRHESRVRARLMSESFRQLIGKDLGFFANQKVGSLTTNFIEFVRSEITLQDLLIIRTLGFVLAVSSGLVILAFQMWPLALVVAGFIIALLLEVKWSTHHRTEWRESRRTLRSKMFGALADAINNNLIVKTFAGEKHEQTIIDGHSQAHEHAYIKDIGFTSYEGSSRVGIMTALQIVAMALCAYFVLHGQMQIAVAVFVLAYMQRIGSQLFTLGEMLNGYDQALLDAAPMTKVLLHENAVNDTPDAPPLVIRNATIKFKNISFHYDEQKSDVLHNINLTIPSGQRVGLVGLSGAGKTTLSHLLLRFADTTAGDILIDDQAIRSVTQASLRQAISFVPQEPMLFHRSLRDNVAYGRPDASDAEITRAIRAANASDFVKKLPNGADTLVGERGVKLSGGQRQRIAIARAILKDAPILLLDEATSALDSESEKLIQDALADLMKGRTSIIIAHRLSTIAKLDRIIVLDHGRIVEDGTHAELLAKKGIYAKLWNRQSGGFIEE
jgi:ATP-binding cassette subfamily B protein